MCWHKWDVKKKVYRIFFERVPFTWAIILAFVCSGITTTTLYVVLPSTGPIGGIIASWALLTGFVAVIYGLFGFLGGMVFEETTQRKDKICRKCHLTILDASQYEREVQIPYWNRVEIKAQAEKDAEQIASVVFADRKQMWFKAND